MIIYSYFNHLVPKDDCVQLLVNGMDDGNGVYQFLVLHPSDNCVKYLLVGNVTDDGVEKLLVARKDDSGKLLYCLPLITDWMIGWRGWRG